MADRYVQWLSRSPDLAKRPWLRPLFAFQRLPSSDACIPPRAFDSLPTSQQAEFRQFALSPVRSNLRCCGWQSWRSPLLLRDCLSNERRFPQSWLSSCRDNSDPSSAARFLTPYLSPNTSRLC